MLVLLLLGFLLFSFISFVCFVFFCFGGVYRHISYLPLAHIYERMNVLVMLHFGVGIGFYQGVISLCPILLFFQMCCVELASSYCSWWCNIVVMGVCSGCTKADGGHWGVKTHYILQCSSPLQSHFWQVKMHPLIPCILSLFWSIEVHRYFHFSVQLVEEPSKQLFPSFAMQEHPGNLCISLSFQWFFC